MRGWGWRRWRPCRGNNGARVTKKGMLGERLLRPAFFVEGLIVISNLGPDDEVRVCRGGFWRGLGGRWRGRIP